MTPHRPHLRTLAPPRWLLILGMAPALVHAHGGEDHGDAPVAVATPSAQAPRAVAQTEDFELVAVLGNATLTLYLDRYATNQPVEGATIEVESGAFKAVAKPQGTGAYSVPAQAFQAPGRYPLTVSVQTADGADLLDATLVNNAVPPLPAPDATTSQAKPRALAGTWWTASWATLLALVAGGMGWTWGRRTRSLSLPEAHP